MNPRFPDKDKDRLELPFEPGIPGHVEAITERGRALAALLWAPRAPQTVVGLTSVPRALMRLASLVQRAFPAHM